MAEDNQQGATGAEQGTTQEAQMAVQHIYLKDASFEAPSVLELDQSAGQPDVSINLSQRTDQIADNRWQVVLSVTVTAKQNELTAFLCEVQYGGIFELAGFGEQQIPYVINVLCPNVLFPYNRNQIASLVGAGGFYLPPLQPINFESIFRQRLEEARDQQGESGEGDGQAGPAEPSDD